MPALTSNFVTVGSAATVTVGDTYTLAAGAFLITTDLRGLLVDPSTDQTITFEIAGLISGNSTGISLFGGGSTSAVNIAKGGLIRGTSSFGAGIFAAQSSTTLVNEGTITSSGKTFDINNTSSFNVTNSGLLTTDGTDTSGQCIVVSTSAEFTLNNSGIVRAGAGKNAITLLGTASDTVTNESNGRIEGAIDLGAGDFDTVNNAGVITGTISLGAGDDIYDGRGSRGVHTIDGGAGADTFYINTGDIVIETTPGEFFDEVRALSSYVLGAGVLVETIRTENDSATTAINLTGNEVAQNIFGNAGNNILDPGADTLQDHLLGLAGNDTYVLGGNLNDKITESGGIDTVTTTITRSLVNALYIGDIENLTLLGTGNIGGTGNALANVIRGNSGNNTLDGGIEATAKTDTLIGGTGEDTYIVRNAVEAIVEGVAQGFEDRVRTTVSFTLGAGDEIEYLETTNANSTAAINLTGNEFGQNIVGNKGANTLKGLAGSDSLDGGVDNVKDILEGGTGGDAYMIRSASDEIRETALGDFDEAIAAVSFALAADDRIEFLRTIDVFATAALQLTGNDFDQAIQGNRGNNVIKGLGGADTITGDWGTDTMTGGTGSDAFVFDDQHSGQTATTMDKITDFTKGAVGVGDSIDYSGNLTVGGNTSAATSARAKIDAKGIATFANGSGTTLADALSDIANSFAAGGQASGEFALFRVNGTGFFHLFISDGVAGVGAEDTLIQLAPITSIGSISLATGDLTILV